MKNLLLCAGAALALAACGNDKSATADSAVQTDAADSAEIGDFGVETANIDDGVAAGDDFYQYVNGGWLNSFEIPDEYSSYGSFTSLAERSENRLREIIEGFAAGQSAADPTQQKVGDFYASYLDVEAINAKGLEPLAGDLAAIDALASREDVAAAFMNPALNASSPVAAFIGVDAKHPDQYAVYITQSGLGMPNRDYYLEEKFADKQVKYRQFIERILTLAGVDNAAAKADEIYALELSIAKAHWEPAKRRNRDLTYNPKTVDQLAAFAPEAPWGAMMAAAGLQEQTRVIVREDDAVSKLAQIFAATPIETWKDYLTFHLLRRNADILPEQFDDAAFDFYGTQLRGTPKKRERWKRGVDAVDGSLGEAVGKAYVEKYFPAESKAMMDGLVANLRTALKQRIEELPWMGQETKLQALDKLSKFTPKIGYPDKWRDYSGLTVVNGDAYGNAKRAAAFEWAFEVGRLGGPVDRTEWSTTPQTVNAYYNSTLNEITFPAAILQAPFFDPHADLAVNYGGIGAVIGHELGHGFDDQGRKSDGNGVLRDWWTAEDAARFEKLTEKLGAQYAAYEPVPGFPVNPTLTMGENIGDVGGLAMAYHAYKLALNGKEAPVLDGLTGDQRFFLSWAQVWKRVVREEALKNQIATDPHSPAQYRVNGVVRNMDAWYDAFGVTPDNELYLPPEDRVQIW